MRADTSFHVRITDFDSSILPNSDTHNRVKNSYWLTAHCILIWLVTTNTFVHELCSSRRSSKNGISFEKITFIFSSEMKDEREFQWWIWPSIWLARRRLLRRNPIHLDGTCSENFTIYSDLFWNTQFLAMDRPSLYLLLPTPKKSEINFAQRTFYESKLAL